MKSLREKQDSQYLARESMGSIAKTNNPIVRTSFSAFLAAFLASIFLVTAVLSMFTASGSLTAFADDEEDSKEEINKLADDYIVDKEDGDPFWGTISKFNGEDNPAAKKDFSTVMARLFTTQYMNDTHKGATQSGMENGINGSGRNCAVDHPNKGTPLYHNCDVPNIITELIQDAASLLIETGPKNAEVQKSAVLWSSFGLPSKIPGKGAPVKASDRSVKYTGLELYGYGNLRYTTYGGEWDHLKVMTTARALANFGWMDNIKMSVTAVFQGVATGMEVASDNFTDEISTGNVFGAIGGFFTGFFEGAAAGGIHSILDTSDLNVFNTYAWYRVGYGGTLYNARELTGAEIAAKARAEMMDMITGGRPDDAKVPEDLEKIKEGPDDPKEDISKCVLRRGSLDDLVWGTSIAPPGVKEKRCEEIAKEQYKIRQAADNPPKKDNDKYKWTKDGHQKKETLKQWNKRNKDFFKTANKYGIDCKISSDESKRKSEVAKLKSCWPEAYSGAESEALKGNQTDINDKWVQKLLEPASLQKWIEADPSRNFNAPWNRFVCTTASGKDMKQDGKLVMLYTSDGKRNEDCKPARPPIQNGLFGNGYLSDQKQPQVDTRNSLSTNSSFISLIFPMDAITTSFANVGLSISTFVTRASNTVINLTFSPVFKSLGIDTLVVKLIKEFRDSIFFPLVALMVAITGVMALWSAGKNKDYKRQVTSLLLMVGVILSGVFLMYKPDMTLKMVDEIPAEVEKTIIGTIFTVGNSPDDELCSSTGTVAGKKGKGLDGKVLNYNPNDSARTLMCENWRAFAFNPWVYGQWGTDMNNLYSNGSGADNTMNNTNGDLVGTGSVNMGGGKIVKNWSIYQLDKMSSGTASHADPDNPTGKTDRNFYRLVDLQAGPNNGAGTDSQYFENWSGSNWGERLTVGLMSPIVALFGAITIIVYAITKIQIAFATVIMLIFLPIIFLFGIHPTMGMMKLKGYIGTIIGLMLQRIVLVTVMAVMLRVVVGFTNSSGSYLINALAAIVACVAFLMMRKQFLDMIFSTISSKLGEPVGGQFVTDTEKWQRDKVIKPNGFLANKAAVATKGAQSIAAGGIAGFISGGVPSAVKDSKTAFKIERTNLLNRQRRRGYGPLQSVVESAGAGKKVVQDQSRENEDYKKAENDALRKTHAYKKYEVDLENYENFDGTEYTENNIKYKFNEKTGETLDKPKIPELKSRDSYTVTRELNKLVRSQNAFKGFREQKAQDYYEDEEAREEYLSRKEGFDSYRDEESREGQAAYMADIARDSQWRKDNEPDEGREELDRIDDLEKKYTDKYKNRIDMKERMATKSDRMKLNLSQRLEKAERAQERNRKAREFKEEKEEEELETEKETNEDKKGDDK